MTQATAQSRHKEHRRRWLTIGLGALVLLALGVLVVHFIILPRLVRVQVRSALAQAGFERPTFSVARSSPWGAELRDVSIDEGLTLDRLGIDYTPTSLWAGDITGLEMTGVTIQIGLSDGQFDLGVLQRLQAERGGSASSEPAPSRPIPPIILHDSTLVLKMEDQTLRIPVEGQYESRDAHRLHLTANVDGEGITIDGTATEWAFDLDVASERLPAGVIANILSNWSGHNIAASGSVALSAEMSWSDTARRLSFRLDPQDLSVQPVPLGAEATPNPITVDGVFTGEVHFASAAPALRVAVEDGSVASTAWHLSASGIAGDVTFDGLSPLRTPPDVQVLTVERAVVGEVELTDGRIALAVPEPGVVVLDAMRWRVFGGTIATDDVRVQTDRMAVEMTLAVSDLQIAPLLERFAPDKAAGEGAVSGHVTVAVDWPDVTIGEGYLSAGRDGTVRVTDTETLSTLAEQAAAGAAEQGEVTQDVKNRIVEALTDFQFDQLEVALEPIDGKTVARVHLVGKGRTGAQQGLDYTANVTGLDDLVDTFLLVRRRLSEARQ